MKIRFENTIIDKYLLNLCGDNIEVKVAKYIGFETRNINNRNIVIYTENGNKCNKVITMDDFIIKELNTSKHITDDEIEKELGYKIEIMEERNNVERF